MPQPEVGHSGTAAAGDALAHKDSKKQTNAAGYSLLSLQKTMLLLVWETSLQSSWTSTGAWEQEEPLQWDYHGFMDGEQTELQKKGMGIPAILHK